MIVALIITAATPIIQYLASLTDEIEIETYKNENIEILKIAEAVQEILIINNNMLEAKILSGKTQILA